MFDVIVNRESLNLSTKMLEIKYKKFLCTIQLNRSPAKTDLTCNQGRYEVGDNSPGAESLRRAPKSPNNVTSTFFNTVNLLPKNLRFEHGDAKVASCPGRYLTSLRP